MADEGLSAIKVRALGNPGQWVGYHNMYRRRGGDVFTLKTYSVERKNKAGEMVTITIPAEQQFSHRWMEKVKETTPETPPSRLTKPSTITDAMDGPTNNHSDPTAQEDVI